MYFAKYKGLVNSDIAGFQTEEKRDEWVNFLDPFSKAMGTTIDNCTFEREPLTDGKVIAEILSSESIWHIKDKFNECQEWYIRSVR